MARRSPFVAFVLAFATIVACSLPLSEGSTPTPDATRTALSIEAGQSATALIFEAQMTATALFADSAPATPSTPTLVPSQSVPTVSVSQNTNCRLGPGVEFPLKGTLLIGQQAEVVGKYTPGNYWIIREPESGENCWIWGNFATVTGDTDGLPEVPSPPTPIPSSTPTSTSTPPTSNANLTAGIVTLNPGVPTCSQTFTVGFLVMNTGTQATTVSGVVSLVDTRAADGSQQGSTIGGFPALQPGQSFTVNMPLTVSTWYNEQHDLTLTIDPSNGIVESDEGDNVRVTSYILKKGGCP